MEKKEIDDLEHFMFNLRYDMALTRAETIANWIMRQINHVRTMNSQKSLEFKLTPSRIDSAPIEQDGYEIEFKKGKSRHYEPLVSLCFNVQGVYDDKDNTPLKTSIYVLVNDNHVKEAAKRVSSEIPEYLRGDVMIEWEDIAKLEKYRRNKALKTNSK